MGYNISNSNNSSNDFNFFNFISTHKKKIISTSVGIVVGSILLNGIFITPEGHRSVIRTMGKITRDTTPGVNFKFPLFETENPIEIRPRAYTLTVQASTTGKNEKGEIELQMPSTVTVTGNWNVDANKVMDIVREYGSIEQFEDRILDPRVKEAILAEFPKNTIEQLMVDRINVSNNIYMALQQKLDGTPITVTNIMISNIDWHSKIAQAVLDKQDSKLKRDKEQYVLETQEKSAQQQVNTANATRDSTKSIADGSAYSIFVEAEAQAKATLEKGMAEVKVLEAKAKVIKDNPALADFIRAQNWNGQYPNTFMGSSPDVLMSMK
jgi:regulator of protease activity HflC (stomatin/prohibitin superfamily)